MLRHLSALLNLPIPENPTFIINTDVIPLYNYQENPFSIEFSSLLLKGIFSLS
jgi:hypothetical protein